MPYVLGRHKFRNRPSLSGLCYILFSHFSFRRQLQISLTSATTIDSEIYTVIRLDSTFSAEQLTTDPRMMACHLATAAPNILNVSKNFRVTQFVGPRTLSKNKALVLTTTPFKPRGCNNTTPR